MCVDKATTVPEWARPILDSLHSLVCELAQERGDDPEYGDYTDTAKAARKLEYVLDACLHEEA